MISILVTVSTYICVQLKCFYTHFTYTVKEWVVETYEDVHLESKTVLTPTVFNIDMRIDSNES